jgi:rhodanese-related sulfurtransferase
MKSLIPALAIVVAQFAAPAVLACGGHQTTASAAALTTETVASSTDKAAPAQKSGEAASAPAATAEATFKLVTVDQVDASLAALKKDKKPFTVFDANGQETRAKQGIIPTAVLLPSSSAYDLALLPKDKASPVVFYCANEKCTASHTAAKRAMQAGHSDVAVLGAGIKGWVAAGKAVDKPVG